MRGGPDGVAVLTALLLTGLCGGGLVAALVTQDPGDVPVLGLALAAVAMAAYLVWAGPFGFWRIDHDGITTRSLFGRWAARTQPWHEVATITIHTAGRALTMVRVQGRVWIGVTPLAGVTRPLRVLARAAERGLLPAHLTVRIGVASSPRRPAGRRHLRRLRAAGVRVDTGVNVTVTGELPGVDR